MPCFPVYMDQFPVDTRLTFFTPPLPLAQALDLCFIMCEITVPLGDPVAVVTLLQKLPIYALLLGYDSQDRCPRK